MGKEGELWDDSALIKAFDQAISKYKLMHGMSGEDAIANADENLPAAEVDHGRTESEHVQSDGNLIGALETPTKIGETPDILWSQKNSPLELSSSKCEGSSNIKDSKVPPTSGIPASKCSPEKQMISSDVKCQNEVTWDLNGTEEYSKLLNKYYELEGQRQKILLQLNQYNNNYQYPTSSTSAAEEYQASHHQPYDTVACQCSYGCQNWVVSCNPLPATCSVDNCVNKSYHDEGSQHGNYVSPEDPDFVKTAMVAAEKALSLMKEANGGKENLLDIRTGQIPESKSATDLDVVLSAWYTAGFYTGKYLSEQYSEKRKHDQGC